MACKLFNSRRRHNEACADPEIRQMLLELQTHWKELDPFQRGEILVNLVASGCSARGLAEVLPCSASTIFRFMDLADLDLYLTEEQRAALSFGFSPARFLRTWRPKARQKCHYERQPQYLQRMHEAQTKERDDATESCPPSEAARPGFANESCKTVILACTRPL